MLSHIQRRNLPPKSQKEKQRRCDDPESDTERRNDPLSRTERKDPIAETKKNHKGRRHRSYRRITAVLSKERPRFSFIRKIHRDRIPNRHQDMVTERIRKYEKLHQQISGRQKSKDKHPHGIQTKAENRQ